MAFLYANFQTIQTSKFTILYGVSLKKDTMWFDGPVPSWVPQYPDTTEGWDWLYYQPNIFLVTKGSVTIENNKLEYPMTLQKGQGMYEVRSATRLKLTAIEDDTDWICMIPKDEVIYNRSLIKLLENETMTVSAKDADYYYFVADGTVTINGTERMKLDLVKVAAGVELNIAASKDSFIFQIWE